MPVILTLSFCVGRQPTQWMSHGFDLSWTSSSVLLLFGTGDDDDDWVVDKSSETDVAYDRSAARSTIRLACFWPWYMM